MFKTDDKVVQICLAISYTILALYAFINFFNPAYIIDQYPSLESNDTTIFFLIWYGMMNFGAVAGLVYMGYKGLDRAYFAYAIPLSLLFVWWGYSGQASLEADEQRWAATILFAVNFLALVIARVLGSIISGFALVGIYILFNGVDGTWPYFAGLFLAFCIMAIAGIYTIEIDWPKNYLGKEGFENVKVTKEGYVPAIIFAVLLGIIMFGLSDKIYS